MAVLKVGVTVANAMLDQFETTIGVTPIIRIRSGAQPATCATADSGTVLATINLPSDWMAAAASGSKAKSGTWQDASADATGTPGHYRLYDSAGTTCHEQGDITITAGGGAMELDSLSLTAAQVFTITAYTRTLPV